MNISQLAKDIEHLDYVVMRNWDELPELDSGDIDLFVSPSDYGELKDIFLQHLSTELFDIRTIGDNYYSAEIEIELLRHTRRYNGFKIPSQRAHFLSLYYHDIVHKGDDRYQGKLKELFIEWMKPQPPEDTGVGYHVAR